MTTFARFYNSDKNFKEVSMLELENLISDSKNKSLIAELIYERLYSRFLKIFDFQNSETCIYIKGNERVKKNVFEEEYKNGFIQLAACSLLIETFASFLTGENETPNGQSQNRFNRVFEYAETKDNPLKAFRGNKLFYQRIRCGLLHQGETKGKFTITRKSGSLLTGEEINAFRFHKSLKELLLNYRTDLEVQEWDSALWDLCRQKLRHIINNTK